MKIYNEDETQELLYEDCDLLLGYFEDKTKTIMHSAIPGREEIGHYETIREYENGGKDVEWIVEIPGIEEQPAWEETVEYRVYILYTEEELKQNEYRNEYSYYQKLLSDTDYKAIKFAEGWYTAEEYQPTKELREEYRQRIRELEELIK